MTFNIIDRRLGQTGKSSLNRQKFIKRLRNAIKSGIKDVIRQSTVGDLSGGSSKQITIPAGGILEPTLSHDMDSGVRDVVVPGNDTFIVGDHVSKPSQKSDGNSSKGGDSTGEDDFTFSLTKEEFLDAFFDLCELPNMTKRSIALVTETETHRSGFKQDGSPASLNVVRSMRQAKSRRAAMKASRVKSAAKLETQLNEALAANPVDSDLVDELKRRLVEAERKSSRVPYLDPVDLRYTNWTQTEVPSLQAAIICLMDTSGSMTSSHKELAKTFYLLLHLFIARKYDKVQVRWIVYHTVSSDVDEHTFFYGHESGGTIASTGLNQVLDVITQDYPPAHWNTYVAHATDGDNYGQDNKLAESIVRQILPLVQYYAYIDIKPTTSLSGWSGGVDPDNMTIWMEELQREFSNLAVQTVSGHNEVYPVFVKLFDRNASNAAI